MTACVIRTVSLVVLAGLLVFYTWFAFRDDGRLMTVPGVPQPVWFYFDHHANIRNGVGFLILGCVGAAMALLCPAAGHVCEVQRDARRRGRRGRRSERF